MNPWDFRTDLRQIPFWHTKGTEIQYKVATIERSSLKKGSPQEQEFLKIEKLANPENSYFSFSSTSSRRAKIRKVEIIWNEKLEQR
jgi:hypothetical protein